jgi:hypothetical protein
MKKLFQKISGLLFGKSAPYHQDYDQIDSEILANLELAYSFNHAVYLHFTEKNGKLTSFTASISSITERQVVVKELQSNQIRIIFLSKIKKVSFVPENVRKSITDQKNA